MVPQYNPIESRFLGWADFVVVASHGANLGPDLVESIKKLQGMELLRQIIEQCFDTSGNFGSSQLRPSGCELTEASPTCA